MHMGKEANLMAGFAPIPRLTDNLLADTAFRCSGPVQGNVGNAHD
jgi:hypothetical protein